MAEPVERPVSISAVREAVTCRPQKWRRGTARSAMSSTASATPWTLLVVLSLGEQAVRFGELRRAVAGISKRMLSVTLRNLEWGNGLVNRRVIPATPPQVE